ncbi:3'-5' exonuclease [Terasakiella brassicae]|nr:3'-5' exonuclease [Terasakiella brassicae]
MWQRLKRAWMKKRLQDPSYGFLFEEEPENEYVCFDLETTNLDPRMAQILSIGAVRIRDHRVLSSQKFYLEVRAEGNFDEEAIKVHRIRKTDAKKGHCVQDAVKQLVEFIGSRPIVGYYLEFDVAVVNRYLKDMIGIGLPNRQIEVSAQYYDWQTRGDIDRYVDLSFENIRKTLDLPALPAHNAVHDALMTALCFVKLKHQTMSAWRRGHEKQLN